MSESKSERELTLELDANRKRILTVELALYCYYARHQEAGLCDCRLCVTTRRILHLAVEDECTPAQRKVDALADIGDHRSHERRESRDIEEARAGE